MLRAYLWKCLKLLKNMLEVDPFSLYSWDANYTRKTNFSQLQNNNKLQMHFWTVSRHFQRSAPASLLSSSVSLTRIPYFRCRELSGTTSKTTYLRLFLNWFPRILKFENVIFLSSSASLTIVMLSITLYDISGRFMRFLCDFWCWRFFMRFLVLAIFMRFLGLAIFCWRFFVAIFGGWRFFGDFWVSDFLLAIFL